MISFFLINLNLECIITIAIIKLLNYYCSGPLGLLLFKSIITTKYLRDLYAFESN